MTAHIRFDVAAMSLLLLDQRALPLERRFMSCQGVDAVADAIRDLAVRGAPAIGVSAAWGCCLAVREAMQAGDAWREWLEAALARLAAVRPTAVNLQWAVQRMRAFWSAHDRLSPEQLLEGWLAVAQHIQDADIAANQQLGRYGASLLADGDGVMTHCNAGALATAGYGTALGVIRSAIAAGKKIQVIANETRPVLQGARLTAYELHAEGIPVRVACDNAAGLLMRKGLVQKVLVGADRIAANGDTANKIGTYSLALLAEAHRIPFYVAAPLSTFDGDAADGDAIPLEERDGAEVALFAGVRVAPVGVGVYNFAFDVTPARLISGIITEAGVLFPPYGAGIAQASRRLQEGRDGA